MAKIIQQSAENMKTPSIIIRVTAMLFLIAPLAMAADWPQWRGPNRNDISPETIRWSASGPKQIWKVAVGLGYSSVSISKGRAIRCDSAMGETQESVRLCMS